MPDVFDQINPTSGDIFDRINPQKRAASPARTSGAVPVPPSHATGAVPYGPPRPVIPKPGATASDVLSQMLGTTPPKAQPIRMGLTGTGRGSEVQEPPPEQMQVGPIKHIYGRTATATKSRKQVLTDQPSYLTQAQRGVQRAVGNVAAGRPAFQQPESLSEILTTPFGMGSEFAQAITPQGNDPLSAVGRAGLGFATPASALLAGGAGAAGAVSPLLGRLVTAGFSAQQAAQAVQLAREGHPWDAIISAFLGGVAGTHAAKGYLASKRLKAAGSATDLIEALEQIAPTRSQTSAIPEQISDASLLRPEQPAVGLPQVGSGNAEPQATPRGGARTEVPSPAQEKAAGPPRTQQPNEARATLTPEGRPTSPMRVFRETSPSEYESGDWTNPGTHWATHPDLALGQGANKGILVEYEATEQSHFRENKKPGLEATGEKELVAGPYQMTSSGRVPGRVVSVTIKPRTKLDIATKERFRVFSDPESKNAIYVKEKLPDGSVKYTDKRYIQEPQVSRPPTKPPAAPAQALKSNAALDLPAARQTPVKQEPVVKTVMEKVNNRGFTPSQEQFLADKLKGIATDPDVSWDKEKVTVDVPRDGQYRVTGKQAAILHKELTGQDIPGLEHVSKSAKRFSGNLPPATNPTLKGSSAVRPRSMGVEPALTPEEIAGAPHALPTELPMAGESSSGTLQSTIIPGAEEFIEQDVGPAMKAMLEKPGQIRAALTSIFNPAGVSKASKITAQVLRAGQGGMVRNEAVARNVLESTRKFFTRSLIAPGKGPMQGGAPRMNHPAIRFVRSIENGIPLDKDLAHLQPMADWMRESLDTTWQKIRDAGIADGFVKDYWPHMWQRPGRVSTFLGKMMGRKPFAGTESFKFQRKLPTFDDGLNQGLEPITWNPVEHFMLKLHEMNKSLLAHQTWDDIRPVMGKYFKGTEALGLDRPPEEGYSWVNDKISRALSVEEGRVVLNGRWALPTPAADILNNYLSPGLSSTKLGPITDAMRGVGNTLNQAQLGMSAFHLFFVAHDAATSSTALGIQQVLEGRLVSGAKSLVRGGTYYEAPKALYRGAKVRKAYLDPNLDRNTPMGQMVTMMEQSGARVNQAPEYTNASVESLRNALERHNYPGAAFRLVPAAFEVMAKPIMEFAVPRLKLGVAETMLKAEMERLGPKATQSDLTEAAQKVWDSVDNRMGQFVYDNAFWNNYLKEGGQLVQRSLGWNLGSVRELGGGAKDVATLPWRVKGGERAITHRMAYAVALPLQTALTGSIIHYLWNGSAPENVKDMLQPMIDGERWQAATYMKDVLPYFHAVQEGVPGVSAQLWKTIKAKLNPVFAITNELISNEDYYGNPIYGDSPEAEGLANYLLSQLTPFALREYPGKEATTAEKTRQFFGITRAPKEKTIAEQQFGEGIGAIKRAYKKGYTR